MMRHRLARIGAAALMASTLAMTTACDSGSVGPGPGAVPVPQGVPEIALVLPNENTPEIGFFERVALKVAGQEPIVFADEKPLPDEKEDSQPARVRAVAARGVAAVIVTPGTSSDLADALREARKLGTHVVVLGRPFKVKDAVSTTVLAAAPEQPAAALVADLVERAKSAERLPKGDPEAVLLVPEDEIRPRVKARLAALKQALENAKVPLQAELPYTLTTDGAKAAVTSYLEGARHPTIVLAAEDNGLDGAGKLRTDLLDREGADDYLLGGFCDDPQLRDDLARGSGTALIDGGFYRMTEEAVQAAVKLARGESVPDQITVETPLRRILVDPARPFRLPNAIKKNYERPEKP